MVKLHFFKINLTRICYHLVLSDILFLGAWGLTSPIMALFITSRVFQATSVTVGTCTFLYFLMQSIFQIPIARFLDNKAGERDEFYCLFGGVVLSGLTAVCYMAVRDPISLYLAASMQGLGMAMYMPAWSSTFSRHLNPGKVAMAYAVDNTAQGISTACFGLLGGVVYKFWGGNILFLTIAILSVPAAFVILLAPDMLIPRLKHFSLPQKKWA
ncbi:MAG TPA: MFS transporter [Candidatus Paceibacterota bacterium]|nr:MFS transporter [Candidatus Paceibacterota bacterium]